jgi:hypoxanthine phosphoribosyltransferase
MMNDQSMFKKHFPHALRLSWEEVEDLLWKIILDLKSTGYDPDVVIGVARGGLAPARILVDYLHKKYICTFQMGHWEGETALAEKPRIIFPLPEVDLSGKKVLVVDDVCDEGGTMEEVVTYLKPRVGDIRTAVLVSKADSRIMADYCSLGQSMKTCLPSRRRCSSSRGVLLLKRSYGSWRSPCQWKSPGTRSKKYSPTCTRPERSQRTRTRYGR